MIHKLKQKHSLLYHLHLKHHILHGVSFIASHLHVFALLFFLLLEGVVADETVNIRAVVPPRIGTDVTVQVEHRLPGEPFQTADLDVGPGQDIIYRITFTNTASIRLRNVTIDSIWSFGSSNVAYYVPGSATDALGSISPTLDLANNTISWHLPFLPRSSSNTVVFRLHTLSSFTGGTYDLFQRSFISTPFASMASPIITALVDFPSCDSIDPSLSFSGSGEGRQRDYTGSATDNLAGVVTNVQYRLDSSSWIGAAPADGAFDERSESFSFSLTGLSDGDHTLTVRATDNCGNTTTQNENFTVDIVPLCDAVSPEFSFTYRYTVESTRYYVGTISDGGGSTISSMIYQLNDEAWLPLVPSDGVVNEAEEEFALTLEDMDDGDHQITFFAADTCGNNGTANDSFSTPEVDGPTLLSWDILDLTATTAELEFLFSQDVSMIIYYGENPSAFNNVQSQEKVLATHTPFLNDLTPDTKYYFRVVGTNDNGTFESLVYSFTTAKESPDERIEIDDVEVYSYVIHLNPDDQTSSQVFPNSPLEFEMSIIGYEPLDANLRIGAHESELLIDADSLYSGTINAPLSAGYYPAIVTVEDAFGNLVTENVYVVEVVDWFVVTDENGQFIEDAIVTLEYQVDGEWIPMPIQMQLNPQRTGQYGTYGWIVEPGSYRITASKEGYESTTSDILVIEHPGAVGQNLILQEIITEDPPTFVEQLRDLFSSPIPKAIALIENIRNNNAVENFVKYVIIPAASIAAALSTISLLAQLGLTLYELPAFLLQMVYVFLELIGFRKKRTPWGNVYNSSTKQSVTLAKTILLDARTNKVVEIDLSRRDGSYGFQLRKGTFRVIVSKRAFSFPPLRLPETYRGEIIEIKQTDEPPAINLFMDQVKKYKKENTLHHVWWRVEKFLLTLNWAILITGLFLSLFSLAVFPSIFSLLLTLIYVMLLIAKIYLETKTNRIIRKTQKAARDVVIPN